MGRGRAKAKQTKVARDLKYRSYSTDFASLERELRGGSYDGVSFDSPDPEDEDAEEDDRYADLADRYRDDDDDEGMPDSIRRIG